jgi:hypothetical protein
MQTISLSKKQVETLKDFFSWEYIEILYWGWARWWKSWLIWVLLAIWIASMPWSSWLVSRTVLSELQATTMSTFYQVLKMLGFWPKSFRDKIREKKHLEFNNGSKVYVIQVDNEPSDPEFDRLGSYSYTGAFLDEWQQMVTKVRSVLAGRFSETSWFFNFKVKKQANWQLDTSKIGYSLRINVIWEAAFDPKDFTLPKEEIKEVVREWKHYCAIVDYYDLFIPYSITEIEDEWDELKLTAVWKFSPITLISCNPWKNFTYTDFYKPYVKWLQEWDEFKHLTWHTKDWTILKRKFTKALVTDNPFVDKNYTHQLEISSDEVTKQRLLYGNFEYDDDPTLLFSKEIVDNLYEWLLKTDDTCFLTVDAARRGKDLTVIMLWKWLDVVEINSIQSWKLTEQAKIIQDYIDAHKINISNVIVDEVWVGWWLVDILWCKWFIANSSALHPYSSKLLHYKKRNYANLRTQAFFYLKQYIEWWKVRIMCTPSIKETINEELLFIRQIDIDWDRKIQLQGKSDMKSLLWRSPDYADRLSFRMYWIIKQHYEEWFDDEDNLTNTEKTVEDFINELESEYEEENEEVDLNIY